MPNYKTHSIHIDKTSKFIDSRIELDKEDLKVFSFGPDSLLFTDYNTFETQHNKNAKYFFECLINNIKTEKAYDNKEIISFLYGQLSHYVLDVNFHPYINYLTNNLKSKGIIDSHLQFELWLDSYFMNKYGITCEEYYSKTGIKDPKARKIIDRVYSYIYRCIFASHKFDIGINAIRLFESNVRRNKGIVNICNMTNIGDFEYTEGESFTPYLNSDRDLWYDPMTGESHIESINELWNKAVSDYLEIIYDVNRHLYDNKELKNRLIESNLSYDTAQNSDIPKKFVYSKKY